MHARMLVSACEVSKFSYDMVLITIETGHDLCFKMAQFIPIVNHFK